MASGSFSFDLANKLAEPMTGRATYFTLYPLSVAELPPEELMIFGKVKIFRQQTGIRQSLFLADIR